MIRIAIVEDDDSYIRALTGYLEQYGEQHSLSFHTSIFHDGLDIVIILASSNSCCPENKISLVTLPIMTTSVTSLPFK